MHDLAVLFVHLITTALRIAQPGGLRSVIAESVLIKHQLLIVNRSRRRAPNLRVWDRLIAGLCSLWIRPHRLLRSAIAFKPSTLLNFHRTLVQRKYRFLFSPKRRTKPGPKGPDQPLIRAVVQMKQHNPRWGCPRIAEQINLAFGTCINKDVVRRILATHYHPSGDGTGPSWLTFIVTRKIAFIVLICSDVNRWRCGRTGYWSLWINTLAALSDSAFTPASSMDRHCVGCSIERFDGKRFRNI